MKPHLLWIYSLGLDSLVSGKLLVPNGASPLTRIFIASLSLPHRLSDV